MYKIFTEVNLADTWRDPDEFVYMELGYTDDLQEAMTFCDKYIQKHFFNRDAKMKKVSDGSYAAFNTRSYGEKLMIQKMNKLSIT